LYSYKDVHNYYGSVRLFRILIYDNATCSSLPSNYPVVSVSLFLVSLFDCPFTQYTGFLGGSFDPFYDGYRLTIVKTCARFKILLLLLNS